MKTLVVDTQAVRDNLAEIKKRAGGAQVIADLSANGQGLGLMDTAALLRDDGIRFFAVSEVSDAAKLRRGGFTEEQILMLRSTVDTSELGELLDLSVICTVGSYDACIALNGLADARGTVAEVQIKIDTGLGRYGFLPSETDKILNVYHHMSSLAIVGVYTRLSAAWKDKRLTEQQLAAFTGTLEALRNAGCDTGLTHALDSSALMRYDFEPMDAVLIGSAIAGCMPGKNSKGLTPAAHIEAPVEELTWMQKGERVGSGADVVLKRTSKIGVLSLGWANGVGLAREGEREDIKSFIRRLRMVFTPSGAFSPEVRLAGKRVRTLGRVGMTYLLLDLTDIDCRTGDIAVISADPRMLRGFVYNYK